MKEVRNFFLKRIPMRPVGELISHHQHLSQMLLKSRQMRLTAEGETKRGFMYYASKTALEFIPFPTPIPLYGVGDLVSLAEGIIGEEFKGGHIDPINRGLFIIAALIPAVPAIPLRELIRMKRQELEDVIYDITN